MKAQPRLRKDGQPSRSGAHFRDSNFQKRMRQRVSREACARNGRKGFQATRNRYGLRFVVEQVVSWRRQNPTDIEKTVMGWLDEFQLLYDKDVLIADNDSATTLCWWLATPNASKTWPANFASDLGLNAK